MRSNRRYQPVTRGGGGQLFQHQRCGRVNGKGRGIDAAQFVITCVDMDQRFAVTGGVEQRVALGFDVAQPECPTAGSYQRHEPAEPALD